MNKPQEWDTTEAFTGDFRTIQAGGHICKILAARTELTRSGKECLVVMFDIAEGESKDFYSEQHSKKAETNPDAKWQGVYRQSTEGNSLKFFKGMITAIENSNSGYKFDWNEDTLRGKLFGGVFGEEEYQAQDGSIKKSTKCRFIRSVDQIRAGVEVPEIKRLKQTDMSGLGHDVGGNSFGADRFPDEEIPF